MNCGTRARVVILGGGFAGLYAALALQKAVPDARQVQATVVNRDNYFLFTPMLHEVAASDLDITHIVNPIRKLLRQAMLFAGEVEDIDLPRRKVIVSHAGGTHRHVETAPMCGSCRASGQRLSGCHVMERALRTLDSKCCLLPGGIACLKLQLSFP